MRMIFWALLLIAVASAGYDAGDGLFIGVLVAAFVQYFID